MNSNLDRLIKEVLNESQLLNETYYCWHHDGYYPNGNAKCSRHVCGAAGYHHHNTVSDDVYSKPSWDSYFGCTAESVGPPGGGDPTSVDSDFVHEPDSAGMNNPTITQWNYDVTRGGANYKPQNTGRGDKAIDSMRLNESPQLLREYYRCDTCDNSGGGSGCDGEGRNAGCLGVGTCVGSGLGTEGTCCYFGDCHGDNRIAGGDGPVKGVEDSDGGREWNPTVVMPLGPGIDMPGRADGLVAESHLNRTIKKVIDERHAIAIREQKKFSKPESGFPRPLLKESYLNRIVKRTLSEGTACKSHQECKDASGDDRQKCDKGAGECYVPAGSGSPGMVATGTNRGRSLGAKLLGGNCDHCGAACEGWSNYQQCWDNCCGSRDGAMDSSGVPDLRESRLNRIVKRVINEGPVCRCWGQTWYGHDGPIMCNTAQYGVQAWYAEDCCQKTMETPEGCWVSSSVVPGGGEDEGLYSDAELEVDKPSGDGDGPVKGVLDRKQMRESHLNRLAKRIINEETQLLTEAPFACPSNPLSLNLGAGWVMEVQLDPNVWMDVSGNGQLFNVDFSSGRYICKLTYTFNVAPGGGEDEGLYSDYELETAHTGGGEDIKRIIRKTINESQLLLERPCFSNEKARCRSRSTSCCNKAMGSTHKVSMGCKAADGAGVNEEECTSRCGSYGLSEGACGSKVVGTGTAIDVRDLEGEVAHTDMGDRERIQNRRLNESQLLTENIFCRDDRIWTHVHILPAGMPGAGMLGQYQYCKDGSNAVRRMCRGGACGAAGSCMICGIDFGSSRPGGTDIPLSMDDVKIIGRPNIDTNIEPTNSLASKSTIDEDNMIKEQFSGPNWEAVQQAWATSTPPLPPQAFIDRMQNMGCAGMQKRLGVLYNKLTSQLGATTGMGSGSPSGTNPLWQSQINAKAYWIMYTGWPNCSNN